MRYYTYFTLGMGLFLAVMVMATAVSVEPLFDRVAGAIQCPDAIEIRRGEISGGTQQLRAGSAQTTGTKIVTLTCLYADNTKSEVGNDTAALSAIGGGAGIGFVLGVGITWLYLAYDAISKRRNPPTAA